MYYNEFGGNMDSNQVNYDFAKAWDLSHGNFAEEIAQNIINFARCKLKLKLICSESVWLIPLDPQCCRLCKRACYRLRFHQSG